MGPEDRQRADRLDRYWDAVVQHEPGTLTPEVDTVTATIIAQLNTPPARPELSAPRVGPVESFSGHRVKTAEMVQPASVTENTTRLLDEESDPRRQ